MRGPTKHQTIPAKLNFKTFHHRQCILNKTDKTMSLVGGQWTHLNLILRVGGGLKPSVCLSGFKSHVTFSLINKNHTIKCFKTLFKEDILV